MHHTTMYNYPRLPALMNYEAAKQHFDAVVPIRGRYPEEKPLGAVRRYTHMTIRKEVTALPVPNDHSVSSQPSIPVSCIRASITASTTTLTERSS